MKTEESLMVARAIISAKMVELAQKPDVHPAARVALTGIHAALCFVLDIPGKPYAQMEAILTGLPVIEPNAHELNITMFNLKGGK